MTFSVINYDNTVDEYTVDSWERFVEVAKLDKCVMVIVKEGIQKTR